MVFESIVKELLNRYLGAYVENLDANQLNLGIWSGNVELSDLTLKPDALKDLDLPIEVVYGYLGKLSLKIPWKNLYTEPVIAVVERLYVLAKPSKVVAYDAAKDELRKVAEKRAKLKLIEETNATRAAVTKLKTDKSFMEKMIVQIVNNIQIKISDIHVRYEDGATREQRFAVGLTLKRLDIHTTDVDWQETYVKDQSSKTFKVANLSGLAVYMNCSTESFDRYSDKALLRQFHSTIGESEALAPSDFNYIFGPISSDTRLKLNSTPQDDDPPFGVPKVELSIALHRVTFGITRHQYQNVIALAENLDRSLKGAPYREFRPYNVPVKGHAKKWWLFAYHSVLEPIRRRRKEWSWEHMAEVRHMCRKYEVALKAKRISRKPSPENLAMCAELEEKLDLFNLIRIQNMVDILVAKLEPEKPTKTGWFSSWFGGGSSDKTDDGCGNQAIMKQLGAAMTPEEKQKLFHAIGYQEQATPLELPKEFVAMSFFFELHLLEVVIRNEYLDLSTVGSVNDSLEIDDPSRVVLLQLRKVRMNLDQRPAAAAMLVNIQLGDIGVFGVKQSGRIPALVKSRTCGEAEDQLRVRFETNPLDNSCEQSVLVRACPLEIIFDGETILQLIKVFTPPKDVNLSRIQDAAAIRMASVKERSATGLQFMVESRPRVKIDVELMPIYFVLPFRGIYEPTTHNSLIASLGTVRVFSTPRTLNAAEDVQAMYKEGHTSDDILLSVLDRCYDTFNLQVEHVQILFVQPGDNWELALREGSGNDMHLLEPTKLEFTAHACLIADDPRLPRTKCSGRLPYLGICMSQDRFFGVMNLLLSIPRPAAEEQLPTGPPRVRKGSSLYQSTTSLASKLLENEKARTAKKRQAGPANAATVDAEEAVQFSNLLVDFVIDEISVSLLKSPPASTVGSGASSPGEEFSTPVGGDTPSPPQRELFLELKVRTIELFMRQRTFDSKINLNLGSILLMHYCDDTPAPIKIITTERDMGDKSYLLRVEYVNTSRDSPDFVTKAHSVEQKVEIMFSLFVLCLHQEGLGDLMGLADDLQKKMSALTSSGVSLGDRVATAGSPLEANEQSLGIITEDGGRAAGGQVVRKTRGLAVVDSVQMKVLLHIDELAVMLDSNRSNITNVQISQLRTTLVQKKPYTEVAVHLKGIFVEDMGKRSLYPMILSVMDDAIDCKVVLYNVDESSAYNSDNMKIDLRMGGLKLVFVNLFVQSVLNFLDHFNYVQEKLRDASSAAADAAKKNVVDAYERATRVSLKVRVKAPIIVVPIDSQSLTALCLDMGHIHVSNHFVDVFDADERNAVLDEMKLELSDFKLFRAEIVPGDRTSVMQINTSGNFILAPMSFTLHVVRNLTFGWYTAKPELEVSGQVKAIHVNLLASDYGILMDIMNRNLTEGSHLRKAPRSGSPVEAIAEPSLALETSSALATVQQEKAGEVKGEPVSVVRYHFSFTMDSLVVSLFSAENEGLAMLGVYVLSTKGNLLANGNLGLRVILYDIQLEDIREERQDQFTRYMGRKVDTDAAKERSMIDITCQQQGASTFADVRISGFDLIISMDFLMRLSAFATVPAAPPKQVQPTKAVGMYGTQQHQAAAPTPPRADAEAKRLNVTVVFEQPDIILMEKMDGEASNALIMNFELKLKLRQEGLHQSIDGNMNNFNLHMCEFAVDRRDATKYYIVHPVAIHIHGDTPETLGLNVSVRISDVNISISPLILELVNRIIAQTTSRVDANATVKEVDYSDLWAAHPFNEEDHWFTQTETGQEAMSALQNVAQEVHKELCTVEMPSLVVRIETGYGNHTIPMLRLASKMHMNIRNWSSQITIEGALELGVSYYNSTIALWEPLLEPNEVVTPNGVVSKVPWVLNLGVNLEEAMDEITNERYTMTKVRIYSPETLELTVTKSCLEVFQDLGVAFTEALKEEFRPPSITAPYSMRNDCGFDIVLDLAGSSFMLHESHLPPAHGGRPKKELAYKLTADKVTEATVHAGQSAYLELTADALEKEALANQADAIDSSQLKQQEKEVHVQVGQIKKTLKIPVHKANKRYFSLYRDTHSEHWGVVAHVKLETGTIELTLHGVVQITNHFATSIFMYRKKHDLLEKIHEIPANATFNVPLHTIYNEHRDWHFSLANYRPSVQGIHWRDSPSDFGYKKILTCESDVSSESFYIHVIRSREELFYEQTTVYKMESVCYTFDLRPHVSLRNTLPMPIVISIASCGGPKDAAVDEQLAKQIKEMSVASAAKKSDIEDYLDCGEKVLGPGEQLHLPTVKLARAGSDDHSRIVVRLVQYLEKDWSCTTSIPADPQENSIWPFEAFDSTAEMSFSLGVHYEDKKGTLLLSLYCPFWMVNKTGLMLSYRLYGEGTLYHPPDHEGPILFSYPGKHFFGKKRTSVRVDSGEWSDKFSMDVAGSSGMVVCPSENRKYAVAVHNALTEYTLTKKITFLPFYVLVNKAPFDIEVQESSRPSDPWISVPANTVRPLWPKTDLNQVLRARCCDDPTNVSIGFKYTDVQITCLMLQNNTRGGIYVDVGVTEGGVYITFTGYSPGNAPAVLINNTDQEIAYYELGNVNKRKVMPHQQQLFTWHDPAGDRKLYWYNKDEKTRVETDLQKDEIGFFEVLGETEAQRQIYWVSFLDGLQRVLLFTRDERTAMDLQASQQYTRITQDVEIEIFGIGLSVVNNAKQLEIMYLGIASTEVVWEEKKKMYFKQMKAADSQIIETKYQEYLLDQVTSGTSHKQYPVDLSGVVVDFAQMKIIKGQKMRDIRRSFYPGFWFQQKKSPYQTQTHAKLNRIQIDNQTADPIFPVIFSPVSPPKSIATGAEVKPFIEASIVERVIPFSSVKQYKYLRMLIQEFHVKIDMDFITEVLQLITTEESDEKREKRFVEQLQVMRQPLDSLVSVQSTQEQKNFYDQLHLGPLKVHVSFSMQQTEKQNLPPIFTGIGVTLTDINDVVFRLAYFERNYQFLTQKKLVSEAVAHYSGQALKQLYVLVFGLDVLGNPYGLVVGIKQGVEDLFYEPFQGLIQGPEEFAHGLVLGVRSLFGHTVGGAAGALSKMTGAVGKGLATLTFDKDFQKKRRDQINKKPANLQEGLARSGKGLVMGVFDGVTGVITKPITGAKEDGVGGFFKGIGKGAVGLITKPTSGVIDFASGTFDSVRRATELLEDINRLRPPRYLSADSVVWPYSRRAAEGNKLLREVDKGKYATSDVYELYETFPDPRKVLLASNQRLLFCMKQEVLGAWVVEWTYRWAEIRTFEVTDHAVVALIKDVKKKLFGMMDNKKVIFLDNETKRLRLAEKLNELLQLHGVELNAN